MSELRDNADNVEVVHEESDVDVRTIIWFGAGLAAVALVVHVFLWWLQGFYATQTQRSQTLVYPMAVGQRDQLPPEPRLQDNPQQALRDMRAAQQRLLDGDGSRMPIEEAMRVIVQRGLPSREAPPTPPAKADSAGQGR